MDLIQQLNDMPADEPLPEGKKRKFVHLTSNQFTTLLKCFHQQQQDISNILSKTQPSLTPTLGSPALGTWPSIWSIQQCKIQRHYLLTHESSLWWQHQWSCSSPQLYWHLPLWWDMVLHHTPSSLREKTTSDKGIRKGTITCYDHRCQKMMGITFGWQWKVHFWPWYNSMLVALPNRFLDPL